MDLRWRSMSRRRRARATLAWSATEPSGWILPSRSLRSARKSPRNWARAPRRGKGSAPAEVAEELGARAEAGEALGDGVEHALGVGGAVEHTEKVEDLFAFQAGAFD